MENIPFSEIATGGVSVGAILYVVKVFLKRLDDKDKLFTTTIENHLDHDRQQKEKMTVEFSRFTEATRNTDIAINKLIDKLNRIDKL